MVWCCFFLMFVFSKVSCVHRARELCQTQSGSDLSQEDKAASHLGRIATAQAAGLREIGTKRDF